MCVIPRFIDWLASQPVKRQIRTLSADIERIEGELTENLANCREALTAIKEISDQADTQSRDSLALAVEAMREEAQAAITLIRRYEES